MKRLTTVIGFMYLSLCLSVPASGQTENFSGKWIFNKEKSDPAPRVTPVGRTSPSPKTRTGPPIRPETQRKLSPGVQRPVDLPPLAKKQVAAPNVMRGKGIGSVPGGATFDGVTRVADDVPLVITLTGKQMQIVNALRVNDNNVPNTETYTLDGKKHKKTIQSISGVGLNREIQASLKKNKITIEVVTLDPQGKKLRTTRTFSLSEDGRTLTVEVSSQSLGFLSIQKMVYEKE